MPIFTFTATDSEQATVRATLTPGDGQADIVVNNVSANGANATIPVVYPVKGTYTASLVVDDLQGSNNLSNVVTQAYTQPNHPPVVANAISDKAAVAGVPFTFTVPANTCTDQDGDSLTYAANVVPGWASYNASTRVFSGTPLSTDVGANLASVSATDGTASATEGFTINVAPAGENVATGAVTINGLPANEGQQLSATSTIADVDGVNSPSFQWSIEDAVGSNTYTAVHIGPTYTPPAGSTNKNVSLAYRYTEDDGESRSISSNLAQVTNTAPVLVLVSVA